MRWMAGRLTGLCVALGMSGVFAAAQGGPMIVSDAQVESNVIRQLATAPELSTQNIQSTTVYGVVTLTGNVHDEAMRSTAENLASRALGVKKVVDQMTLGDAPAANADSSSAQAQAAGQQAQGDPGNDPAAMNGNQAQANGPGPGQVLMSDGTYGPASGDQGAAQQAGNDQPQPAADNGQQPPNQQNQQSYNPPPADNGQPGYGPPQQQPGYGSAQGQPYPGDGGPGRQPLYNGQAPPPPPPGPYAGQRAGMSVTIPAGTPLQVRLNRGFNSNNVQVGTPFTATVMYDVVAGGAIAIPRGAMVSGTVTEAKRAGAFGGKGQLGMQITGLTLGGQEYALVTAPWDARGRDKTGRTVGSAVGLGILGALVGGAVGGGAGAAVGAGIGAGAGVAASGASQGGEIILPPESMIGFAVDQPFNVVTVSQQEMARLSYAAGPPPQRRPEYRRRYYSPYYGYYYGPGM